MKLTPTRSVGTTPVARVTRAAPAGRTAPAQPAQAAETGAARPVEDTVSVMGIPAAELTPKVRDALMTLMAEVEQMRRELTAARERLATLERLADRDPLIPVSNRRAFVRELTRSMAHNERYGSTSSVVYVDLNDFKEINDTHGHAAGDEALRHVATLLERNVRESDTVGRLGGDEFGIILDETDGIVAREKAESLAATILESPLQYNGRDIPIRVAIGVYTFSGAEDVGHALAAADRDMYANKRAQKEAATGG